MVPAIQGAALYPADDWRVLAGAVVEVRMGHKLYRRGLVDDVMPDGSGLWLASEGADPREFILRDDGYRVWSHLYPPSPNDASGS